MNNILKITAKYLFVSISILTMLYLCNYENIRGRRYINKVDEILSNRIWYSEMAYKKFGYTIIGQKINYNKAVKYKGKKEKPIIDNLYVRTISNYGVFYLVLFSIIFIAKNKDLKEKEYIYVIMFCIIATSEAYMMQHAYMGIPFLMLGNAIANRREDDETN